jgi:hypothetical protein
MSTGTASSPVPAYGDLVKLRAQAPLRRVGQEGLEKADISLVSRGACVALSAATGRLF